MVKQATANAHLGQFLCVADVIGCFPDAPLSIRNAVPYIEALPVKLADTAVVAALQRLNPAVFPSQHIQLIGCQGSRPWFLSCTSQDQGVRGPLGGAPRFSAASRKPPAVIRSKAA